MPQEILSGSIWVPFFRVTDEMELDTPDWADVEKILKEHGAEFQHDYLTRMTTIYLPNKIDTQTLELSHTIWQKQEGSYNSYSPGGEFHDSIDYGMKFSFLIGVLKAGGAIIPRDKYVEVWMPKENL